MNAEKHDKNSKRSSFITITVYAVLWFILYIIANISVFKTLLSSVFSVLSPLVIGLAVALLCNPIMNAFDQRVLKKIPLKKLRRGLSIAVTYVIILLVIALFVFLIVPELTNSVNELFSNFDNYITNVVSSVNKVLNNLFGNKENAPYREFLNPDEITEKLTSLLSGTGTLLETIYEYAQQYGGKFVTSLSNIVIGVFISFYLLLSKEKWCAHCNKFFRAFLSDDHFDTLNSAVKLTRRSFGSFVEGKIVDSLIIGVLTFIVLTIFRMPYTALISVVVGVTNVIPYFGPFIGAIPSAFIILIAEPGKTLPFLLIILIIQQLDGNVIGPRILGENTGLSSLGIILSITIMSGLFGVLGMLIGVPICAVIVTLVTQIADAKLTKKGKSVKLEDYYAGGPPESTVTEIPSETSETPVSPVFDEETATEERPGENGETQ